MTVQDLNEYVDTYINKPVEADTDHLEYMIRSFEASKDCNDMLIIAAIDDAYSLLERSYNAELRLENKEVYAQKELNSELYSKSF